MAFYASNHDKKLFHKVLVKQLKKLLHEDDYVTSAEDYFREKLDSISTANTNQKKELLTLWLDILIEVNETYRQFDRILSLKSRSLELSSVELLDLNTKLNKYNKNITNSIVSLKSGVLDLISEKEQSSIAVEDYDLEDLAELIKKLIHENKETALKLKRNNKKLKTQQIELELKNRNIMDGIQYAKRIQESIFTDSALLKNKFPDSFILNLPKDTVSGDFFFIHELNDKIIIALADCTGHGVPGAFTSVIATVLLNEIVVSNKVAHPSEILSKLQHRLQQIFHLDETNAYAQDGLDIAVCVLDMSNDLLYFSGAGRPILLVRKNELTLIKGANQSIGGFFPTKNKTFTTTEISMEEDDMFYLFTDGYADQFGEDNHSKFSSGKFYTLLKDSAALSANLQLENLKTIHQNWKGKIKQLDDILVLGIRYQIR